METKQKNVQWNRVQIERDIEQGKGARETDLTVNNVMWGAGSTCILGSSCKMHQTGIRQNQKHCIKYLSRTIIRVTQITLPTSQMSTIEMFCFTFATFNKWNSPSTDQQQSALLWNWGFQTWVGLNLITNWIRNYTEKNITVRRVRLQSCW